MRGDWWNKVKRWRVCCNSNKSMGYVLNKMNEQYQIWQLRIRPQRVVILISENIRLSEFKDILSFLSMIWGGYYTPILVINKDNDDEIIYNLKSIRPEIVFWAKIDSKKWDKICSEMIHPRYFVEFDPDKARKLDEYNLMGVIPINTFLKFELNNNPGKNRNNLLLIDTKGNSELSLYFSVTYGIVPENNIKEYAKFLKSDSLLFEDPLTFEKYITTCIHTIDKWCWIEYVNSNLAIIHSWSSRDTFIAPVIIVVDDNIIKSLSLFWNLRMQRKAGTTNQFIMFPAKEIENKELVKLLTEWLKIISIKSNFCQILSVNSDNTILQSLARRIRPRLKNCRIKYVDVDQYYTGIPEIIPYLKEYSQRIYLDNNIVSFDIPHFEFKEYLGSSDSLLFDFVKNKSNGRSPFDLLVPPRQSVLQVLNAPSYPSFPLSHLVVGIGKDSINMIFNKRNETIKYHFPSEKELLSEILFEKGIKICKDEKRIRYLQSIEILGGLRDSVLTFSGNCYYIISAFRKNSASPLTYNQIKSYTRNRFSNNKKKDMFIDVIKKHFPEHARRVGIQRYKAYKHNSIDDTKNIDSIIEKLISRGILRRKWKLECKFCDKPYWSDNIDIKNPLRCPGCGKLLYLKEKVELGYELNELVALSIREGIIPVILTGRFLHNLTSNSFLWLPGVKCSIGDINTDLDIFASCDGYLVTAECKELSETKKDALVWNRILDDLHDPIEISAAVGVDLFVFSAMTKNIPDDFIKQLDKLVNNRMITLYLNKNDLEKGYRKKHIGKDSDRYLSIDDLIRQDLLKRNIKKRKRKGARIVTF